MNKLLSRTAVVAKKSVSIVLAISILLSVCVLSGLSAGASTTTNGQKVYINLTKNDLWNTRNSFTVRFTNSNGDIKATFENVKPNKGVVEVTAPAGATKLEIASSPFTLPEKAVADGNHRLIFKADNVNGTKYSTPYAHYYGGDASHPDTEWPGVKMTKIGTTNYYYVDIHHCYKSVNFSDIDKNGDTLAQTDDLPINFAYSKEVAFYNGSNWANPYVKYLDLTSIPATDTEYYLLSDGTFEMSKYISVLENQETNKAVTFKTVYVYGENWTRLSNIYATYDYQDQYKVTVTLEREAVGGKVFFKGKIPADASVRFQPQANTTTGASPTTQYPVMSGVDATGYSDNTATFKYTKDSRYVWCKRSDIDNVDYDSVVENTFKNTPGIIGVDATYFDYISDNEHNYGYLQNEWNHRDRYGQYGGGNAMWFPFTDYNKWISDIANKNSSWKLPLYFGNFYKFEGGLYGYNDEKNGLVRYYDGDGDPRYAINNSNGLGNLNQSIQGLAYSRLDADGDIQSANGLKMPFFDEDKLLDATISGKNGTSRVAHVYKSYFPFRTSVDPATGVTTYRFDSTNATDNVYFTWDGTTPKYVNYGAGTTYGVRDAAWAFGNDSDGYGIFPFNNTAATKTMKVASNSSGPQIASNEILVDSSKSVIYLWLFSSTSGESDKQVTLSNKETRDGKSYFVINPSVYGKYTKMVIKPNSNNWDDKSDDIVIAEKLGKIIDRKGAVQSSGNEITYTRGGNDNLNFGFGIRLDIDFRVLEYGTVDGTPNGKPVSFDYFGDDDIWVYIGEDPTGADAELVLDLGGDHKCASGTIDFSTMTATAHNVYANFASENENQGPTIPNDEFWVKTGSYTQFCVYTWGNSTSYITPYATADGYYKFRSSQFGGNTGAIFCKWKNVSDGKLTGDLNLNNLYGKAFNGDGSSATVGSSGTNLGKQEKRFGQSFGVNSRSTYKNLDPNKTYHMTVFYMERGLAESNFSIGFTMSPANNDLKVEKTLDTGDVVPAMAEDLKSTEIYNYEIQSDKASTSQKVYELNGVEKELVDSKFALMDTDTAFFKNTFKTDSNITVTENLANKALKYETSWVLSDNKIGSVISSGDSTKSVFKLVDPQDTSAYASLKLDYTNKIKTNTLDISKQVTDESGNPYSTNQQFTFRLSVDLDGEDGTAYGYKAYPLEYIINGDSGTIYRTTADGEFAISPAEKVTVQGLPVGATYKLEEYTAVGYKPVAVKVNNKTESFTGETSGIVIGSDANTIVVGNSINPIQSVVQVLKNLDGSPYNGSEFAYVIKGLGAMPLKTVGDMTVSTAGRTQVVTKATNGGVVFDDAKVLSFVGSGYYRFIITEAYGEGTNTTDYIMDDSSILVEIEVDSTGNVLAPKYRKIENAELAGVTNDAGYAPFFNDASKFATSIMSFDNTTKHGNITVNKFDTLDNPLENTTFALIKVSESNSIDEDELKNILELYAEDETKLLKETTVIGDDGNAKAKFENIVIFKDGNGEFNASGEWVEKTDDYINGTTTQQMYCLFEYSPAPGYMPTGVQHYFTLPVDGKYDITFDYVDGAIVVPNASGDGVKAFAVAGMSIIFVSALLAGSYVLYDRSERKKRVAKYGRR